LTSSVTRDEIVALGTYPCLIDPQNLHNHTFKFD